MKKQYRVKKQSEIDAVFNNKKQSGNGQFSVFIKKNTLSYFRYGLSIGKKYGNAVSRNKIKRQVRSVIRLNKTEIIGGYDFIIVIKPRANQLTYNEIEDTIIKILKKVKIMENKI